MGDYDYLGRLPPQQGIGTGGDDAFNRTTPNIGDGEIDTGEQPGSVVPAPQPPRFNAGDAPDPSEYAAKGEMVRDMASNPSEVESTIPYLAGQLLQFHRGGTLDAQHYGSDPNYGNYNFGVFNAAAGVPLSATLNLANVYGGLSSNYPSQKAAGLMDPNYSNIPAANVANIKAGYNEYQNGTLWQKPK